MKTRQESDSGLDVPGQQIPMDVQDKCTRLTEENMRMPCSGPNLKKSYLIFENSHVTYPMNELHVISLFECCCSRCWLGCHLCHRIVRASTSKKRRILAIS